jgi:hypothetical protein
MKNDARKAYKIPSNVDLEYSVSRTGRGSRRSMWGLVSFFGGARKATPSRFKWSSEINLINERLQSMSNLRSESWKYSWRGNIMLVRNYSQLGVLVGLIHDTMAPLSWDENGLIPYPFTCRKHGGHGADASESGA